MKPKSIFIPLAFASSVVMGVTAIAQDQAKEQKKDQTRARQQVENREQIYGSQLMTEQERKEHQERMRSMKSQEERDAYRAQHQDTHGPCGTRFFHRPQHTRIDARSQLAADDTGRTCRRLRCRVWKWLFFYQIY